MVYGPSVRSEEDYFQHFEQHAFETRTSINHKTLLREY